jgi:hypothetical protein
MKIKKSIVILPVSLILLFNCYFVSTIKAMDFSVKTMKKERDGITIKTEKGSLRLQVFAPGIIRVVYGSSEAISKTKSFAVIGKPVSTRWKVALLQVSSMFTLTKQIGLSAFMTQTDRSSSQKKQTRKDYQNKVSSYQRARRFTVWVSIQTVL